MANPLQPGISLPRRQEIIAALRNGTVPQAGLDQLAVGIDRFSLAIDEELDRAALGQGVFKAVRGEWGGGKTFFARWLQHRAQMRGFATAEVQISETETPLYRLETVYRRAVEHLRTREWHEGTFKSLIDRWFFALEEEVLDAADAPSDPRQIAESVGVLLESRLAKVSATQPQFAAALRAVHRARMAGDNGAADGLLAWLSGQPHVAAAVKARAGLKGDVDHYAATGFLRGLLAVLQQTGRKGLVLVLDEVETLQRMRSDVREKSLNAMRQMLDDLDAGRYPGLYLLVTGTPTFFEGPQGARQLPPLAQRLHVDFAADARFDSARAVQIRLQPFDEPHLIDVGRKVRALYPTRHAERLAQRLPDEVLVALARQVAGKLGGKVGMAPRLFLKKLVGDVMDRIEEHPDFDPTIHYRLQLSAAEMRPEERDAAGIVRSIDDLELDLAGGDAP